MKDSCTYFSRKDTGQYLFGSRSSSLMERLETRNHDSSLEQKVMSTMRPTANFSESSLSILIIVDIVLCVCYVGG